MSVVDLEFLARVAHEANRAYCESLHDFSQPRWDDAPEWQRKSALNGVRFHLATLEKGQQPSPAESHKNWMSEKLADGWMWGEVKDPAKKLHPCILEYKDLPAEQRAKDFIFIGVVRGIYEAHVDIHKG